MVGPGGPIGTAPGDGPGFGIYVAGGAGAGVGFEGCSGGAGFCWVVDALVVLLEDGVDDFVVDGAKGDCLGSPNTNGAKDDCLGSPNTNGVRNLDCCSGCFVSV